MKKNLYAAVGAIVLGFVSGYIISFLLTPLLWKLEAPLHLELAGHSGPEDWIIILFIMISGLLWFLILRRC